MEVRCPSCRARYDVEPDLVKSGPVRLQCSKCDKTFRLQLAGPTQESWKVRRKEDGKVLALDGLPTLQRWIVERRVDIDDEIVGLERSASDYDCQLDVMRGVLPEADEEFLKKTLTEAGGNAERALAR